MLVQLHLWHLTEIHLLTPTWDTEIHQLTVHHAQHTAVLPNTQVILQQT
jgi:hypothetical protein